LNTTSISAKDFGNNFKWGIAISAAQNEGAYLDEGRGLSIWDTFARKSGKIKGGIKPTDCCDFYHRYKDDLLLVKALGFNTFRFSVSWSRILPDGLGKVNKAGIAFYNKLIDECLINGLEPMITLYHWDLPNELEKKGGWTSHLMRKWFERFTTICVNAFGDRVSNWVVMNEPSGFTTLGYMVGQHAPGKIGFDGYMSAIHNAALCTADGGRIIRSHSSKANIGTAFSCSEVIPYKDELLHIKAACKADIILNRIFIEPALGLGYPEDADFPFLEKLYFHSKAWKYTRQMQFDFDFIGIQNYFSLTVKHNSIIPYINASEVKASTRNVPHTDLGWEINPESFYRMIKRFWDYGNVKSIMVTEGGACFKDQLKNGEVNDDKRIAYYQQYLGAALKAKQEGVNLNGYLAWTLTDNFEWAFGYNARFGLIHVDFDTQLRTIKKSGYWFRNFLKEK